MTSSVGKLRWREMRCEGCGRLLQKVEEDALRPGKRLEIKCGHCKLINYLVGEESHGGSGERPRKGGTNGT